MAVLRTRTDSAPAGRRSRLVVRVVALLATLGAVFAPAAQALDGWHRHAEENLAFGVVYRAESAAGPLAAHTVT
ncbi:MAG: hypothetical protein HKN46_02180, partial [Acidimicrobiia bacterium]|nr:hypothetical protein [Acidimicrobiia bacterium]